MVYKTMANKMGKSGKKFIKPGSLATQKKTKYERRRDRRIKEIRARLLACGVNHTLASLRASSLPNCTKEKGGGTRNEVDDPDYRLPSDEDESDNESFDSFEHEVRDMPPGGFTRSQAEPQYESIIAHERVTRSTPHPMVETQSSPPPRIELQSEVAASCSAAPEKHARGRGPTRGLEIQGLIDKNGDKLLVPIPQEHRAPVGLYASKLASKIGVEVRENVKDLSVKSWKAVDESIKAPLFQRLKDQFDLEGDPIDVHKAVVTKCGRRLSDHTHRLYTKFKKLKETKGEGYARSHPPPKISMEQWSSLIEKKWTNTDWMKRSLANQTNRSNNKTKHRCGSKSLPVRVNEYAQLHGGELPNLPDFYKSTHYNGDTDKWIAPECQTNYEKMKQIEAEHKEAGTPLTQEELSIVALKKRPGYVKGLGLRPSSSIRTTCESATTKEYVARLEKKIEARDEKIEKLVKANRQQQLINASMLEFLIEKGYIGHLGNAGLSSND